MQLSNTFPKGAFLPSGGNVPNIADQLAAQRRDHRRIFLQRTLSYWWFRVMLFVVAAVASAFIGPYLSGNVRTVLCSMVVVAVVIVAIKNTQAGFLLTAIVSTAWLPKVTAFGTLDIYPSLISVVFMFWLLVVRVAFHRDKAFFPSFWTIWPQIGLIVMAFISEVFIQYTWIYGVSFWITHKYSGTIIGNPVWQDELLGLWMYSIPLTIMVITATVINKKEQWIEYFMRAIIFLGVLGSGIIIYEFRRKGASVSTFRTAEPSVLWMTLRSLSQLLVQTSLIAYARFLYAVRMRERLLYGFFLVFCLMGVYVSLQNSWWVEVGVGMMVMTIIYSRRLITFCIACVIPLLPLVYLYIKNLASAKKDDLNRITIWHDAFLVWTKRPILGVGPGNYWVYDQYYTTLARNLRNLTLTGLGVTHDGFLQVLVETGPVGEFFYIASTVVIAIAAYRLYRRYNVSRKKYSGFLGFVDLGLAIDPHAPIATQGRKVKLDFILQIKNRFRGVEVTDKGLVRAPRYLKETRDFMLDSIMRLWVLFWGIKTTDELQKRRNSMLGLIVFGLVIGSAFGDLTSSSFFLPPRQLNQFVETPQVIVSWMLFGFVLYKDQLWRIACKKAKQGIRIRTSTNINTSINRKGVKVYE